MNLSITNPAFIRLAAVLERERELLGSGAASQAALLLEEKMAALQDFESAFETQGVSETSLEARHAVRKIIQMAEENAAHLQAVRNGLRLAIGRLEAMSASAQVGSYGRDGSQISFTHAIGGFSKKA